jgi:hypothetical protein
VRSFAKPHIIPPHAALALEADKHSMCTYRDILMMMCICTSINKLDFLLKDLVLVCNLAPYKLLLWGSPCDWHTLKSISEVHPFVMR